MRYRRLAVAAVFAVTVLAVGLMWQMSRLSMPGFTTALHPIAQQATATTFPTLPSHLARITPVVTSTLDPSLPTPYFIDTDSLAVRFTKELTETDDWVDYLVRRTNLQAYMDNFVLGVSTPVLDGDDLIWIVIFENSDVMALSQAAGHSPLAGISESGDELRMPGGYVAFLAFDDHGNVFGGGFLDKVDIDGNLVYDAGDWKASLLEDIPELPK